MANVGLIGGIGQGLSAFNDSFQNARAIKNQRDMQQALQDRQAKMDEMAIAQRGEDVAFRQEQSKKQADQFFQTLQRQIAKDKEDSDYKKGLLKVAETKAQTGPSGLTPGQKVFDQQTAKDLAEYQSRGGSAPLDRSISTLSLVESDLAPGSKKRDEIAGRSNVGLLGEQGLKAFAPSAYETAQRVNSTTLSTLKDTLGAQFTEKEGEQIKRLSYDPLLSADENLRRVRGQKKLLEAARNVKEEQMAYFDQHGTLKGFKMPKVSELMDQAEGKTAQNTEELPEGVSTATHEVRIVNGKPMAFPRASAKK